MFVGFSAGTMYCCNAVYSFAETRVSLRSARWVFVCVIHRIIGPGRYCDDVDGYVPRVIAVDIVRVFKGFPTYFVYY